MRSILRLSLFLPALLLVLSIQAQHPAFITPRIWLSADSVGTNNNWQDISGNGNNAYLPGGVFAPDSGWMNFHPSLVFDSLTEALSVDYRPQGSSHITVFAVFRPSVGGTESGIWSLRLDSAYRVMVSTQQFGNFFSNEKYSDSTMHIPAINLLRMSWPYKAVDTLLAGMNVVGTDSLTFRGKFAEFMFYDTPLKYKETERTHTYLAIKYGISVQKMNYLNSQDSILWNYKTDSLYSNRIAGIGKDSALLVDQKQSCGMGGEANLTIAAGTLHETNEANPATISELDYLIWGDNGKELMELTPDTLDSTFVTGMSECKWLMRRSGQTADGISTQVILHAPEYTGIGTIQLVINRSGDFMFSTGSSVVIAPASSDTSGNYYFNGIVWDTDGSGSDAFGFQLTDTLGINLRSYQAGGSEENCYDNGNGTNNISSFILYPNPNRGEFTTEIRLISANDVLLSIQDEGGKTILQKTFSGSDRYLYSGNLEEKGCYLIKAESGEESKTIKLIVQ